MTMIHPQNFSYSLKSLVGAIGILIGRETNQSPWSCKIISRCLHSQHPQVPTDKLKMHKLMAPTGFSNQSFCRKHKHHHHQL
jgi:hypothetical protein